MKARLGMVGGAAIVAAATAGLAFACAPQYGVSVSPNLGIARSTLGGSNLPPGSPPGSGSTDGNGPTFSGRVRVSGSGPVATRTQLGVIAPVEIRWNSPNGPELATVSPSQNGTFSVEVNVPPSPLGQYLVLMVVNGSKLGRPAFFQIAGPDFRGAGNYQPVSADTWSGFRSAQRGAAVLGASGPPARRPPVGTPALILAGGSLILAAGMTGVSFRRRLNRA